MTGSDERSEKLESLYGKYCVEHELKWVDSSGECGFYIFFSGGSAEEYRLYVCDRYIALEKEKKVPFRSRWLPVSRMDFEHDSTIKDAERDINGYLNTYQHRHREGKLHYGILLRDAIRKERKGEAFESTNEDKAVLKEMLKEINAFSGQHFKYFAELDHYHVEGAGEIVRRYIQRFPSEMPKALLLHQMVADKTKGRDELILGLYEDFKKSPEYLPLQGPSSAYIYVQYDNALKRVRSKRIEDRLIQLMESPMDDYILPFTLRMLARRHPEQVKHILMRNTADRITPEALGLDLEHAEDYHPSYSSIVEQLKYSALVNLKYCCGEDVMELLQIEMNGAHKGFRKTAQESWDYILKQQKKAEGKKYGPGKEQ